MSSESSVADANVLSPMSPISVSSDTSAVGYSACASPKSVIYVFSGTSTVGGSPCASEGDDKDEGEDKEEEEEKEDEQRREEQKEEEQQEENVIYISSELEEHRGAVVRPPLSNDKRVHEWMEGNNRAKHRKGSSESG